MRNRVLVFDDDESVCASTVMLLSKYARVMGATNMDDAAAFMREKNPPGVLIVDIQLKGEQESTFIAEAQEHMRSASPSQGVEGGLAFVHAVQQLHPETRIVLLSGTDPKASARALGVFGYISKQGDAMSLLKDVCLLGPLLPEELDASGKYREAAMDLESNMFKGHVERFMQSHRERMK